MELQHAAKHVATAFGGGCRIGDRIEVRRRLRDARERRGLADGEVIERLAEVRLGGGRHSIGSLAEKDHIQIQRENFLLREFMLEALRDEDFLELATDG